MSATLYNYPRSHLLRMTCRCTATREEPIGMLVEVGRFGCSTPDQAAQDLQCPKGHVGAMTAQVVAPPPGWPRSFMGQPVFYGGKIS